MTPRQIGRAVVFLLVIAAASLSITLQGWRSRAPVFDLLPHVENALRLVHGGTLPVHGDTGSYGSYKPPGTAWVMAPSLLVFDDTRLAQYVGAAILHIVALAGVFWLAWRHFGTAAAYLAALLYAVSEHGLFLAASLWPNGRPDVFVALVVFTVLWVSRRDSRFLAIGVAIWGIGMYIDMAITPAAFILPVVWLYERPPVRVAPLVVAAAVLLLVWFPYLRFEAPRAFIDIRSQLLQQNIFPANYRESWCNPAAVLRSVNEPGAPASSAVTDQASLDGRVVTSGLGLGRAIGENAVSNFNAVAPIPGAAVAVLAVALAGLVLSGVPGRVDGGSGSGRSRLPRSAIVIAIIVVAAAGLYVATSPALLGKVPLGALVPLSARRLLRLIALGGAAALAAPAVAWAAQRLLARSRIALQSVESAAATRALRISLVVPWVILVVMAEPGKPERFWWLWPLQLVFLSGFVLAMLPRLGAPRWAYRGLVVVVVLVVLANGFLTSRLEAWAATGWGGPDADEVQIVDDLARRIKEDGRHQAAIGYQTFVYPFMATYNITNPRYKVGAEFDFLLRHRHGIENTDRCAEGVAAFDDYRLVQNRPKVGEAEPREYFEVPRGQEFRLVRVFELYRIFKRD